MVEVIVVDKGWHYQVTNVSGQVIKEGIMVEPTNTLNLKRLDGGVYFLKLTSNQKREVHRIVKQ